MSVTFSILVLLKKNALLLLLLLLLILILILIWFDLIWFDLIWFDLLLLLLLLLLCFALLCFALLWFDLLWFALLCFDLIWFDSLCFDSLYFALLWFCFFFAFVLLFAFIYFVLFCFIFVITCLLPLRPTPYLHEKPAQYSLFPFVRHLHQSCYSNPCCPKPFQPDLFQVIFDRRNDRKKKGVCVFGRRKENEIEERGGKNKNNQRIKEKNRKKD